MSEEHTTLSGPASSHTLHPGIRATSGLDSGTNEGFGPTYCFKNRKQFRLRGLSSLPSRRGRELTSPKFWLVTSFPSGVK